MSITRPDSRQDTKATNSMAPHVAYSAAATLLAHPARVCLNRASMFNQVSLNPFPNMIATLKDAWPYLPTGVLINLIRGSIATGSQSYAKQHAQEWGGLSAGIFAAAFTGTVVATFIETPFVRRTMGQGNGNTLPLWRFSFGMSSMYFFREIGFSLAVLAKNDLSPTAQQSVLMSATYFTAAAHKMAALDATRDMLPQGTTVPNIREGFLYTVRAMSRGNVYTHPAFKVPFPNPANLAALTGNFLHVSCGANMFIFRLAYLTAFREAYHLAKETSSVSGSWSRFFKNDKHAAKIENAAPEEKNTPRRY
jgi:hypothetical protein